MHVLYLQCIKLLLCRGSNYQMNSLHLLPKSNTNHGTIIICPAERILFQVFCCCCCFFSMLPPKPVYNSLKTNSKRRHAMKPRLLFKTTTSRFYEYIYVYIYTHVYMLVKKLTTKKKANALHLFFPGKYASPHYKY